MCVRQKQKLLQKFAHFTTFTAHAQIDEKEDRKAVKFMQNNKKTVKTGHEISLFHTAEQRSAVRAFSNSTHTRLSTHKFNGRGALKKRVNALKQSTRRIRRAQHSPKESSFLPLNPSH